MIEDDLQVATVLTQALEAEGSTVLHAPSGEAGLSLASSNPCSLVILDVGLPDMSGFQVLEGLTQAADPPPVLMLTAEDSEDAIVRGLGGGADDYLVKPFSVRELMARIRAVLRRRRPGSGPELPGTGLKVDLVARTVTRGDVTVRLTSKELGILWALMQDPDRTFSREQLLREVWGINFDPETSVFDVHLSRLRRKLSPLKAVRILTKRGKGYRLEIQASPLDR